ncbi:FecCD family ABC transporter permease [Paroceanicella profunda]|uniref:FecCD family ABC transporter permease n=1 Tax=Paroceanicella profunda TaxID=2579971 RepID=UPI001980F358|nr:iron ABC transporter permease [Paroceanicella profunda]
MASETADLPVSSGPGRALLVPLLVLATVVLALAGLGLGPVAISPAEMLAVLTGHGSPAHEAILLQIRAPRVVLALAAGTSLALSGATLQGVLRNPLADPGLIGVTAGAALGAVSVIVLMGGARGIPAGLAPYLLPLGAFAGAGAVTAFVFLAARNRAGTSVATLILAGVAVNAIAFAGIGGLIYVSDDVALRTLSLWQMGSLGGAGWPVALVALGVSALAATRFLPLAGALDLFQLGERAAFHAGLDVERAKFRAGLWTALATGAATAAAGPIGFIGLVAPHLARLMCGPGHRAVLPVSALTGTALLMLADLATRLAIPPAEPPIGLATSLIGGPFFLWLLLRRRGGLHG